eukprot:SAG31_NODE_20555_length_571_cov_0.864407_1_plen_133_part_10
MGLRLALSLTLLRRAAGTKCEFDCSLNGKCDTPSGQCMCGAGWTGPRCSTLRLQPAERNSGLHSVDDGRPTSSWGGVVNKLPGGPSTGWGMVAAEMVNHCGIDSWTRNSRIVFAVSNEPGGKFRRQLQIEGYF